MYIQIMLDRARTESCGTPACIFRGVDNLPSTATLKSLLVRKELISLIKLTDNRNLDSLYSKPVAVQCQRLFQYPRIPQP
jgi:hypothetical protein